MCDVSSTVGITRCYKTEGFCAFIAYKDCENFGDSRTLKADIGLLNICIGFHDLLA